MREYIHLGCSTFQRQYIQYAFYRQLEHNFVRTDSSYLFGSKSYCDPKYSSDVNIRQRSISSFDQIVSNGLQEPLVRLCAQLASEGAVAEHEYFNQIVLMLSPPRSEITVLEAIFQLSNCAFLNYEYSFEATEQIDKILERAISLSEVMSADSRQ